MESPDVVKLLVAETVSREGRECVVGRFRVSCSMPSRQRWFAVWAPVLMVGLLLAMPLSVWAQTENAPPLDPQMAELDRIVAEWKESYFAVLEAMHEFRTCEEEEQDALRDQFLAMKAKGDRLRLEAIEAAAEIYRGSASGTPSLFEFLQPLPVPLYEESRFRLAGLVSEALYMHNRGSEQLLTDAIRASFFGNDFETSARMLEQWQQQFGPLPDNLVPFSQFVPIYREAWSNEQAHLERARKESVLPQVRFETDKGSFVVEFDEDRYPVIVNNLIYGIENSGFYRGTSVFYALEKQYLRSGCPMNNGMSSVPVGAVTPETAREAPRHFRGTFALLINPGSGTAVTQFNICRTPTPEFDGADLPVGRVIEGMHVVDQLTNTVEMDDRGQESEIPDIQASGIIDVEVLKKREHGYTAVREN